MALSHLTNNFIGVKNMETNHLDNKIASLDMHVSP